MFRNISMLLIGLICIFLFASQAFSFWGNTVQEEFHNTYEVGSGTKLNIHNINGSVEISLWNKNYVDVYAVKKTRHGEEELNKIEIDVNIDAGDMNIITKRLDENVRASVDYDIKVPVNVVVNRIDNSNGKIELTGTKGDSVLHTSNGKIVVTNVNGLVSARTSNGRINISGTTGLLKAKTSNGNIEAEIPDINTDGLEIITSNGSIDLYLPGSLNADVEMKTSNGRISLHDIQILTSEMSKSYVKGKIGDGGNNICVKTSNGKINLYKM